MTETFSQNSFDIFLSLLDADREQAGVKYEALRRRLIKFFEWRNCEMPEELADVVFDRVLKKISEGEQIQNVTAFSATIAQFVFKEYLRSNERQNQLIEDAPEVQNLRSEEPESEDEFIEKRRSCFEKCLAQFDADSRKFIIAYYTTDEKTMIAARKKLAEEMNSNLNTIRIKACRLKGKLEECTKNCQKSKVESQRSNR